MKGHIRKRGKNSWAIKLELPPDSAGNRRSKWHSIKGTKRDAERERIRLLHELNTGAYVEPKKQTVTNVLDSWLRHVKPRVRAKTFERYGEIVEHHLKPTLDHHKIEQLQPVHISEAWAKARASGRRDGSGGLAERTVLHHHRVLSAALRRAVRLQLIYRNPAEAADTPRPPKIRDMNVLNLNESAHLLNAIQHRRLYIIVFLALSTGMRRSEILGLRWRDVDLDGGFLRVTQTLQQTKDGVSFQPPKTDSSRRKIALPGVAVEALRRHKITQSEERLAAGLGAHGSDSLVTCKLSGAPLQPRHVSKEFSRTLRQAGMKQIRFHDLRHTHATHLLESGVHPKVAQERLGHSTIAVTMDIYSHVSAGMQEEAAAKIDASLRKSLED